MDLNCSRVRIMIVDCNFCRFSRICVCARALETQHCRQYRFTYYYTRRIKAKSKKFVRNGKSNAYKLCCRNSIATTELIILHNGFVEKVNVGMNRHTTKWSFAQIATCKPVLNRDAATSYFCLFSFLDSRKPAHRYNTAFKRCRCRRRRRFLNHSIPMLTLNTRLDITPAAEHTHTYTHIGTI